jgi:predicted nucleotidyltransferase
MTATTGLTEKTVSSLQNLFHQNLKIVSVILYGSRAKGTFKNGSDIDLTIDGPDLSLAELLKLENDIDNLLLPYKVDLSILQKIENPELVEHINRVGKIFYQRTSKVS